MTENFSNLVMEKVIQVQEAQRVPNKLDPKRPTPRHIIIKMTRLQDKERMLRAAREKQVVRVRFYSSIKKEEKFTLRDSMDGPGKQYAK